MKQAPLIILGFGQGGVGASRRGGGPSLVHFSGGSAPIGIPRNREFPQRPNSSHPPLGARASTCLSGSFWLYVRQTTFMAIYGNISLLQQDMRELTRQLFAVYFKLLFSGTLFYCCNYICNVIYTIVIICVICLSINSYLISYLILS